MSSKISGSSLTNGPCGGQLSRLLLGLAALGGDLGEEGAEVGVADDGHRRERGLDRGRVQGRGGAHLALGRGQREVRVRGLVREERVVHRDLRTNVERRNGGKPEEVKMAAKVAIQKRFFNEF